MLLFLAGLLVARASGADVRPPDRALAFDGHGALVLEEAIPGAFDLAPGGEITIAAWFRSDAAHPRHNPRLLSKRRFPRPATGYEIFLSLDGNPVLLLDPGYEGGAAGASEAILALSAGRRIEDGAWHHLALVVAGDIARLYFDGVQALQLVDPQIAGGHATAAPLVVGGGAPGEPGVPGLRGEVDDLSIWHRALSAAEVRRLRYATPEGDAPGLVAWWSFDEEDGAAPRDRGPHGHRAWLEGEVARVDSTRPMRPPWHETPLRHTVAAFAVVVAAALAALLATVRSRTRNRWLEVRVADRTRELEAQRRQIAEQARRLEDLDRAKSDFFANVGHELRTPLTLLLSPLADAAAGARGLSDDDVSMMHRNAQRLLRLIDQLLDLQRAEAGVLQVTSQPGDLAAAVRAIAGSFASLAARRGISLRCATSDVAVPARFDRDALEKVVGNLLGNAIKFTERGGTVEVTVEEADGEGLLSVTDTGEGIPEVALPYVFDRFYQVDAGRTRRREGVGIGLALTRELVLLQGGRIEVASRLGEGTRFTVTLPSGERSMEATELAERIDEALVALAPCEHGDGAATAAGEPRKEEPAADSPGARAGTAALPPAAGVAAGSVDGAGERGRGEGDSVTAAVAVGGERPMLLVVDDNRDLRAYVRAIFEPEFAVLEAEDGEAGLERARERLPDLVIADVMMPRCDGFDLARTLASSPMTAGVPVILLTARTAERDVLEGLSSGAVAYLRKPFTAAVLRAQVAALLVDRRRLRERLRREAGERPFAGGRSDTDERRRSAPAGALPPVTRGSRFAERVRDAVRRLLHEEGLDVERLARELATSRSQLHRRLREEAATSPSELLREVRLERAAELLAAGEGSVTEVAYAVGFGSLEGFSRAFGRRFGVLPSDWLRGRSAGGAEGMRAGSAEDGLPIA